MAYDPDEGELFDIHWPTSAGDLVSVCFFNTVAFGYACVIIGFDFATHNPVGNAVRRRHARKKSQKARKARREQLPVPLPLKRNRALSLPLPESLPDSLLESEGAALLEKKQITNDQLGSLFFKLPLEIREEIYMYVFAAGNPGSVIHIQTTLKRVGHYCGRPNAWFLSPSPTLCDNHASHGLLALPLTCRRIYTEAIGILYSKPTFFFNDPQDLVYFAHSVLPHRLNAVRFIEMTWNGTSPDRVPIHVWVHAWIIISQMTGLKEMRVRLGTYALFSSREDTVRPLLRVKGLDVFELIVPPETVGGIEKWAFLPQMRAPFTIFEDTIPAGQ